MTDFGLDDLLTSAREEAKTAPKRNRLKKVGMTDGEALDMMLAKMMEDGLKRVWVPLHFHFVVAQHECDCGAVIQSPQGLYMVEQHSHDEVLRETKYDINLHHAYRTQLKTKNKILTLTISICHRCCNHNPIKKNSNGWEQLNLFDFAKEVTDGQAKETHSSYREKYIPARGFGWSGGAYVV